GFSPIINLETNHPEIECNSVYFKEVQGLFKSSLHEMTAECNNRPLASLVIDEDLKDGLLTLRFDKRRGKRSFSNVRFKNLAMGKKNQMKVDGFDVTLTVE